MKFEATFDSLLYQNNNIEWVSPFILKNKLPFDVFDELSRASKGNLYVDKLVGLFPDQYQIDLKECPLFEKHALSVSDFFAEKCGKTPIFTEIRQNVPYGSSVYVKDLWVNEMYSGSYNKLHRHDGIMSFIIFIDVPYTHEDQVKEEQYIDDPQKVMNGCTEFLDPYTQSLYKLRVERGIEGNMFLFPSWIYHVVYPFKNVDKPRISMAGNISFDYRK